MSKRAEDTLHEHHQGCALIIARSFARIHETNLKKQGVVPLTFANEADYDRLNGCDSVSTEGLYDVLRNGGQGKVELVVTKHANGEQFRIPVRHNLSKDQCQFILAGSALNLLSQKSRST